MPRETKTRIPDRPIVDLESKPQAARVFAQPIDSPLTVAKPDDVLSQVANGLVSINPALAKYQHQHDLSQAGAAYEEGRRQAELAALDPNKIVQTPEAMPEGVNPAFKDHFSTGYRETLGARVADGLQNDMLSEWSKIRLQDGADPEEFIRDWTAKNTAGFEDPLILREVSKKHLETVRNIRSDARTLQTQRLIDSQKSSVASLFSDIRADQSNDQRFAEFQALLPKALQPGVYTRSELNGLLVDRLHAMSIQSGGSPEVFDVLTNYKDPSTGKSLADLNPQLAEKAAAYRKAAEDMSEKTFDKSMQPLYYAKQREWEDAAGQGTPPSDAEIRSEIGPRGMFKSDNEALSARNHLYKIADQQRSLLQGIELAKNGMLAAVEKKEDQQKVMDVLVAPLIAPLFASMNTQGAEANFDEIAAGVVNAHARSGGSVAAPQLKNAFASIKMRAPGKDAAPDPSFVSLANLYNRLPPNLKAVYADDEDLRHILESYNTQTVEGRVDPKSAYQQAFNAVSPEAKKLAEEFRHDPDKRAQLRKWVTGEFTKDGAVPNWLRFQWAGTYPTNEDTVVEWSMLKAQDLIRANPNLTGQPAVLRKQLQTSVAESFVYDTASDTLVEVPRGEASPTAAKALSEFSDKARAKYGSEAMPQLSHMGGGVYQLRSATTNKLLDVVKFGDIMADYHAKSALDPRTNEGGRLAAVLKSAQEGTLTNEQINTEGDLLAKASALGILSPGAQKAIDRAREETFKKNILAPLDEAPKVPVTDAGFALDKSDGRSMTNVANNLWAQGRYGMALTTMAEGVRLRAYKDNKGTAIGVGYNMERNAATLPDDFRRAGIPAERIEDVKAGRVQITEDQAMRLLAVTHQRAETTARNSINSRYGKGTWENLPATKQAVLSDVAFQSGSPAKFPEAVDALVKDVGELRGQNPRVHYAKAGAMVEDVRRNEMRFRMLNGLSSFFSTIQQVGSKPRSMIEARMLESN